MPQRNKNYMVKDVGITSFDRGSSGQPFDASESSSSTHQVFHSKDSKRIQNPKQPTHFSPSPKLSKLSVGCPPGDRSRDAGSHHDSDGNARMTSSGTVGQSPSNAEGESSNNVSLRCSSDDSKRFGDTNSSSNNNNNNNIPGELDLSRISREQTPQSGSRSSDTFSRSNSNIPTPPSYHNMDTPGQHPSPSSLNPNNSSSTSVSLTPGNAFPSAAQAATEASALAFTSTPMPGSGPLAAHTQTSFANTDSSFLLTSKESRRVSVKPPLVHRWRRHHQYHHPVSKSARAAARARGGKGLKEAAGATEGANPRLQDTPETVITCTIGRKHTDAKTYLPSVREVKELLSKLAKFCSKRPSYHHHHPHHHHHHHHHHHTDTKGRRSLRGFNGANIFPGVSSPTFRGRIVVRKGGEPRRRYYNRQQLSADNGFWYF